MPNLQEKPYFKICGVYKVPGGNEELTNKFALGNFKRMPAEAHVVARAKPSIPFLKAFEGGSKFTHAMANAVYSCQSPVTGRNH
jgi:type I restriction enzyme M protein